MFPRFGAPLLVSLLVVTSLHAQPSAKARTDALGDPLPEGAIARLGTLRMRHADSSDLHFVFSADGKRAFSRGYDSQLIRRLVARSSAR
jgi:hypothetical protein